MKPITFEFVGGCWDGRILRTDSPDYEEQLLAAGCWEMSHHGAVGAECGALSTEADAFAKRHNWGLVAVAGSWENHQYSVLERRETETELIITFKYHPVPSE